MSNGARKVKRAAQRALEETVVLEFPVQFGEEEVKELRMRRPKAGHLRRAADGSAGDLDMARRLIAAVSTYPSAKGRSPLDPSVVDLFELEDYEAVTSALERLMPEQLLGELQRRAAEARGEEPAEDPDPEG